VGVGVGRCGWEAVYLADFPRSKPYSAASIMWSLAVASGDDWEAASAAVTNGTLRASRKMNMSFRLLCNFSFLSDRVCNRVGVMCQDHYIFLKKIKKRFVRQWRMRHEAVGIKGSNDALYFMHLVMMNIN
jgi:hypothetical protein